ncbi:hypothetical protein EV360DRAFT_69422 [Lentinula raphanica]|nr:hypothetical protein EV360DRAFT_69422 [Lentinula raphanica]
MSERSCELNSKRKEARPNGKVLAIFDQGRGERQMTRGTLKNRRSSTRLLVFADADGKTELLVIYSLLQPPYINLDNRFGNCIELYHKSSGLTGMRSSYRILTTTKSEPYKKSPRCLDSCILKTPVSSGSANGEMGNYWFQLVLQSTYLQARELESILPRPRRDLVFLATLPQVLHMLTSESNQGESPVPSPSGPDLGERGLWLLIFEATGLFVQQASKRNPSRLFARARAFAQSPTPIMQTLAKQALPG